MIKNFLIIFVFIYLANALNQLLDLGPFYVSVRHGDITTPPYKPLHNEDLEYSQHYIKLAKKLVHDKNILPLIEPYVLDKFAPIPVNTVLFHNPISLTNINIEGLSKVILNKWEMRWNGGSASDAVRVDAAVSIPLIEATADLSSSTKIFFVKVPVTGNAILILHGVEASIVAEKAPTLVNDIETYQYKAVDVVINVDDVEVLLNIKGLPLPGGLGKSLVEHLIKEHKEEVTQTVTAIIVEEVNKAIARFSVEDSKALAAGEIEYPTVVDMAKVALGPNPHRFGDH